MTRLWRAARTLFIVGGLLCIGVAAFGAGPLPETGAFSWENLRWSLLFLAVGLAWGDLRRMVQEHGRRIGALEEAAPARRRRR